MLLFFARNDSALPHQLSPMFYHISKSATLSQKSQSSSFLPSDPALITDLINGAIDTSKYQISYANDHAAKTCPRLEVTKDFCSGLHTQASDKISQIMHLKLTRNGSNPFYFCNLMYSM